MYKPAAEQESVMAAGKRKISKVCKWLGHAWDCADQRACRGNHQCERCSA